MPSPSKSDPRPFADVASEGSLGSLVERVRLLDALDRQLRQSLPEPLRHQCRLANIRADRLVFLVSSPVWSAKLRLHADALYGAAAAVGLEVGALTVKVATMQPVPPDQAPHTPLSPTARDTLRTAAGAVADPDLKERLLRLASLAES
jgi:hypothetical protein